MKKTALFLALLSIAAISFAQENPCPIINSSGVTDISNDGNNTCVSRAFINATGVQSNKSIRIQVFAGSLTTTALIDECKQVPRNSTATYFTADFTVACDASIFLVITRYTASNGDCQGGICGIDTLDESGGPLPIQMTGFYAKRKNNAVTLSWQTSAELNAKEFVIQKKMGSSFVDIASVAADNKADGSSYSF